MFLTKAAMLFCVVYHELTVTDHMVFLNLYNYLSYYFWSLMGMQLMPMTAKSDINSVTRHVNVFLLVECFYCSAVSCRLQLD